MERCASEGCASGPATVAVITATDLRAGRLGWLEEMHASLHRNTTPWVQYLAVNGAPLDKVPARLAACSSVRVIDTAASGAVGSGGARNVALFAGPEPWVTAVDDDDVLPDGSIDLRMAAVGAGDVWIGGLLCDLVDGVVQPVWEQTARPGAFPPGRMLEIWDDPAAMFPYHGSSLLMRREAVLALGGWAPMRSDADIFLHLALTSAFPGRVIDDVVLLYRKHVAQRTVEQDYLGDLLPRRTAIRERAQALTDLLIGPLTGAGPRQEPGGRRPAGRRTVVG